MEPSHPLDRRPNGLGGLQILSDEILCHILHFLHPPDVGILSCVSSVFYILCNEEPLWKKLCLQKQKGLIEYKGSWRQTALEKIMNICVPFSQSLHFDGFSSLFLYRRWYRCNVVLESFLLDNEAIERRSGIAYDKFTAIYDGKKPVILTDLAMGWPALHTWTVDKLVERYGEVAFRVSQNQEKDILMRLKDYASYMTLQHDEDPLYIFDADFGELAPDLLQDYQVPSLFEEDLFGVLDQVNRPPFRWLVVGPARSGASWHVDPFLTSAWNTLLVGRKRWALYPPGMVPLAVTVHVDEEDGDVNFDGPSSLQWWLDVYPSLGEEHKPLEFIQLPGETVFVPSGWWHCVLNIDTSVAITQNFVNSTNFDLVCLDMLPGYRHRGAARAGPLALKEYETKSSGEVGRSINLKPTERDSLLVKSLWMNNGGKDNWWTFSVDALNSLLEDDLKQLHTSNSCKFNNLNSRHMLEWFHRLWVAKPDLQSKIWKSACHAFDMGVWLDRVISICNAHSLPHPEDEEQLLVGDGTNPVFLIGAYAIKLYIDEDDGESIIDKLGSELQFYSQLTQNESPLRDVIPAVVAAGILYLVGEIYHTYVWDGTGNCLGDAEECGVKKKQRKNVNLSNRLRTRWAQAVLNPASTQDQEQHSRKGRNVTSTKWPYIITKRCKGENVANRWSCMTKDDLMSLASFLGTQIHQLHCLSLPLFPFKGEDEISSSVVNEFNGNGCKIQAREAVHLVDSISCNISLQENVPCCTIQEGTKRLHVNHEHWTCQVPVEWQLFVHMLRKERQGICDRLKHWSSISSHLRDQVEDYLPIDPVVLIGVDKVEFGMAHINQSPVWLHTDVTDDNIQVVPCTLAANCHEIYKCGDIPEIHTHTSQIDIEKHTKAYYILDFGDVCIGDPLYELIAIYLSAFRGNSELLKQFLLNYKIPLSMNSREQAMAPSQIRSIFAVDSDDIHRLSYRAMCYCLLHQFNFMGAVFEIWKDLKNANTWREIECHVWGVLNQSTS